MSKPFGPVTCDVSLDRDILHDPASYILVSQYLSFTINPSVEGASRYLERIREDRQDVWSDPRQAALPREYTV
jgi:hypothetical protein